MSVAHGWEPPLSRATTHVPGLGHFPVALCPLMPAVFRRILETAKQARRPITKIMLNATDYADIRKFGRDILEIESQAALLKTGRQAQFLGYGTWIYTSRLVPEGMACVTFDDEPIHKLLESDNLSGQLFRLCERNLPKEGLQEEALPLKVRDGISEAEFRAMAAVVQAHAQLRGEDTMGAIMLTSGSTILTDTQLVALGRKIDAFKNGSFSVPETRRAPVDKDTKVSIETPLVQPSTLDHYVFAMLARCGEFKETVPSGLVKAVVDTAQAFAAAVCEKTTHVGHPVWPHLCVRCGYNGKT